MTTQKNLKGLLRDPFPIQHNAVTSRKRGKVRIAYDTKTKCYNIWINYYGYYVLETKKIRLSYRDRHFVKHRVIKYTTKYIKK